MDKNHFQVNIPKPCTEEWSAMTPDAQGRFCGVCQKSVIDFTGKTPDEIARMLSERLGQKVCGRFQKEQLTTTYRLEIPLKRYTTMRLSPVKTFTLALLIAFGSSLLSCTNSQGERRRVEVTTIDKFPDHASDEQHVADSGESVTMGEPVAIEEIKGDIAMPLDSIAPPESPKEPEEIMGKIAPPNPPKKEKVKCGERAK